MPEDAPTLDLSALDFRPAWAKDPSSAPPAPQTAIIAAAPGTVPMPEEAAAASERWDMAPAGSGPRGLLLRPPKTDEDEREIPHQRVITAQFFAIYFAMTGLHGLHVVAGMIVITWLLLRARKRHFSAAYFSPVHLGGLYWHLVDIIWIYLFPLLYLIH